MTFAQSVHSRTKKSWGLPLRGERVRSPRTEKTLKSPSGFDDSNGQTDGAPDPLNHSKKSSLLSYEFPKPVTMYEPLFASRFSVMTLAFSAASRSSENARNP